MLVSTICFALVLLCLANWVAARSLRQNRFGEDSRHFRYSGGFWNSEPSIEIITPFIPGQFAGTNNYGFNITKLYETRPTTNGLESQILSEDLYAQILSRFQIDDQATPSIVHFDFFKNLTTSQNQTTLNSQFTYPSSSSDSSTPLRAVLQNVRRWFSNEPRTKITINGMPVGRAQAPLPEELEYASIQLLAEDNQQVPMRHIALLSPDSRRITVRSLNDELQWLQLSRTRPSAPIRAWQFHAVDDIDFDNTMRGGP